MREGERGGGEWKERRDGPEPHLRGCEQLNPGLDH